MNEAVKYVVDETGKQTEVIVPIELWKEIQRSEYFKLSKKMDKKSIKKYINSIKLKFDPLEYQREIRSEW